MKRSTDKQQSRWLRGKSSEPPPHPPYLETLPLQGMDFLWIQDRDEAMKDSEVYLRAAKRCSEPFLSNSGFSFCCIALSLAANDVEQTKRLRQEFAAFTSPDGRPDSYRAWFGATWGWPGAHNSHYRTIALLFMREIAKSEGR